MGGLKQIATFGQLLPVLQSWRTTLTPVVNQPQQVRPPFNLNAHAASGTFGIVLNWEQVRGADGYVIYYSDNGNFAGDSTLVTLKSAVCTSYFDNLNATGVNRWYRIASTSGTPSQPQSVIGQMSAAIQATSGSGQTSYDQSTGTRPTGGAAARQPAQRYCFSGNVAIQLADGSFATFDELPDTFEIENDTGIHSATLVRHPDYSGTVIEFEPGQFVTPNHLMLRNGVWIPADEYFPDAPRIMVVDATLYNCHVITDLDEDHHYILENGFVAHNFKPQNPGGL